MRTNSTSVCVVSGLVVSYVGVGTCSVTAHVAVGTDYSAANGTAQTRRVGQAYSGTTLKLSATRVTDGDEEAEHLSVIVLPQYSGTMVTGTVTVKESKTTLCAIGLRSGKGSCRLSASRLKAGRYTASSPPTKEPGTSRFQLPRRKSSQSPSDEVPLYRRRVVDR